MHLILFVVQAVSICTYVFLPICLSYQVVAHFIFIALDVNLVMNQSCQIIEHTLILNRFFLGYLYLRLEENTFVCS